MSRTLFSFSRRFQLSSGGNKHKHSVSPILQIAEIAEHVFASLPGSFESACAGGGVVWRGPYISCLLPVTPPHTLWNAELLLMFFSAVWTNADVGILSLRWTCSQNAHENINTIKRKKKKKSAACSEEKSIMPPIQSKLCLFFLFIYLFIFLATSFLRDTFLVINKGAGSITAGGSRSVRGTAAPAH